MRRLLNLKWRLLPLVVALAVLCFPVAQNIWNHHRVSMVAEIAEAKLDNRAQSKIQGMPTRIIIPSLSIDLPVVPQSYNNATKTWPVSPTNANYASNTAQVNNTSAETLIYGHNNHRVFGPVLNMKQGDIVYVYTDNNHVFKYSYQNSQDITPTKLSIFDDMAKAPAGLKLITCDGPNFEYRHLMSLKLLQAS
jgi:LPXTG-site transpeptidase (sortase) family protein